MVVKRTMAR